MDNESIVEENYEAQASASSRLLPVTQHSSHSQLLTKIYYPVTLYPDSYSFFADRGDSVLSRTKKASLPMETSVQYPTKPIDQTDLPTIVSTASKQGTPETENADEPRKYSVSETYLFDYWFYFTVILT